jgi:hypothetical protein
MSSAAPTKRTSFARFAYACQLFFGGWFLFHGLNYWVEFYYDPTILPGPGLVPALAESGVMAIVKVLEVSIGMALLLDVFAALAVVAAWPITLVIAFVNSHHLTPFGIGVGMVIIALNAVMSLDRIELYRPFLVTDGRALAPIARLAGALAGFAAAAAVTYTTIYLLR